MSCMRTKRGTPLIHWIAIIAVAMSSLAPLISQAMAPKKSTLNPFDYVCSVSGLHSVSVVPEQSDPSKSVDQGNQNQLWMDDHCPYCTLQGNYVLPLNTSLNFELSQPTNLFPQLFYKSPKPLFAWLTLPSRAPPLIS